MSDIITLNIPRGKKNLLGGVKTVYLFPYTKYSRSQITLVGQKLTAFPATIIMDWYSVSTSFTETTEIEGGDVAYNQSFSIDIPGMNAEREVYLLMKQDYRAIYIDNNGNIRILGLFNGLEASISASPGGDKGSSNGYKISFKGKENNQAYYIDDLGATGFTPLERFNYVLESGCNYVFENGDNYIFE